MDRNKIIASRISWFSDSVLRFRSIDNRDILYQISGDKLVLKSETKLENIFETVEWEKLIHKITHFPTLEKTQVFESLLKIN